MRDETNLSILQEQRVSKSLKAEVFLRGLAEVSS